MVSQSLFLLLFAGKETPQQQTDNANMSSDIRDLKSHTYNVDRYIDPKPIKRNVCDECRLLFSYAAAAADENAA